jgi:tetratricopeptide (TPR) repeat protein
MSHDGIEALMRRGAWEEAGAACHAALQVQPTNAKLIAYLGLTQFHTEKYTEAEVSFRRATTLDPNFIDAGVKHAQTLDKLRRYEEAFIIAKEWLVKKPGHPTLCGLVHFLQNMVHGERQGWERTAGLSHNVILTRDE